MGLHEANRFFEVRFESIGGLGAHAAGQVLAAAAVLKMGLNGSHFSSYGSEKKGSLVRSYVRLAASDRPIRTSAPIEEPDVVVVFHPALLRHPATLAGMRAEGILLLDAPEGEEAEELGRLPKTSKAFRVDALRIAREERSRPNAVLLGTLSALLPFLDADAIRTALDEMFEGRHPEAVAANARAFARGASEYAALPDVGKTEGSLPILRPSAVWGFETAPIGGVLPLPGNTVGNDLSASRTGWIPVLNREKCIHCALCDMVCPDLCLVWSMEDGGATRLNGIDYRYCKGCLRCVETCPTGAMAREEETATLADRLRVPLFPGRTP